MNDKEIIIKELGSYDFEGFYESPYLFSDEFIDYECELIGELESPTNKEYEVIYEYEDINIYCFDVCKSYSYYFIEYIKDSLPSYIIDSESFLFELIPESLELVSPKYYNYTSDKIYFNIETNIKTLESIKNYVLSLEGAKEYIKKRFTSRDGFISFISNDFQYWKELNINEYESNHLICLFDMLINLSDKNNRFKIMCEVLEDVDKFEYVEPFIYLGSYSNSINYYDYLNQLESLNKITLRGKTLLNIFRGWNS